MTETSSKATADNLKVRAGFESRQESFSMREVGYNSVDEKLTVISNSPGCLSTATDLDIGSKLYVR